MKSKKSKNKVKNFFEKIYRGLENKYSSICDWFTNKGINLNKLNKSLEKKNIPPFPFVTSILIILIFLIFFLIFFVFTSNVNVSFNISDYENQPINNFELTILNSDNKEIFADNIYDENYNLPLDISKTYTFRFSKQGYVTKDLEKIISSKEESITTKLEKEYDYGTLILTVLDNESKKRVLNAKAILKYTINGETIEEEFYNSTTPNLELNAPRGVELDITLDCDGYQKKKLSHTLTSSSEERTEYIDVDTTSFKGENSKVTFVVSDLDSNPISDTFIEILDSSGQTIDVGSSDEYGKSLFTIPTGKIIRFIIKKEGYQTFDSDSKDVTYRILNEEETINIKLKPGGSNLRVQSIDKEDNIPIENSVMKIYNLKGNLVDKNITDATGVYNFTGLDYNASYFVTVCAKEYVCKQKEVNLKTTNNIEFRLDKLKVDNSSKVDIWVYNVYNEPIEDASIKIRKIVEGKEIPVGLDTLTVDVSGYATCFLENGFNYKFTAYAGDSNSSQTTRVDSFSNNKVIISITNYNKLITLDIYDEDGNPIRDGHLKVTANDGTILFDGNIDGSGADFLTKGYKDLIIEHTDENGNKTTFRETIGDEERNIKLYKSSKSANGDTPVIDFVGVENLEGSKSNFITPNQDYYLVFNVIFPENAKEGGVHVRAGNDKVNDVISQSYGIYGFKADTTNFTYSTTYTPTPAPGVSSIDYRNLGSSSQQNKWLELKWNSESGNLGTKQIKVKIRALDLSKDKLEFKYRAWVRDQVNIYRDPKDPELQNKINTENKQSLYAKTKQTFVDLFEIPANCINDFCVSYEFLDEDTFDYTRDKFFAVKNNIYALKATLFSYKNKSINLKAETSPSNPLISFVSIDDKLQFPTNYNFDSLSQLEIQRNQISLQAGVKKNIYLFFIAQNLGNSYISTEVFGPAINNINEKFSFKVLPEKEMEVNFNPSDYLKYNSKLNINILDKDNKQPIENAIIKVKNEYKQLLETIVGNKLNGQNGNYVFTNKYSSKKLLFNIKAYGYKNYEKELLIADDEYISAPDNLHLNFGEGKTLATKDIKVSNLYNHAIEDIRVKVNFLEDTQGITIDVDKRSRIPENSSQNFKVIAKKNKDFTFRSRNAKLLIYGFIGNKQVIKKIDVLITSGQIKNNCISIQPRVMNFYVGESENSENTQPITITNKCDSPQELSASIIKPQNFKNNDLEISSPDVTVNAGDSIQHNITIKNQKLRKTSPTYNYEIKWYNPNYILENNKLNISFFDLDKVLKLIPYSSPIYLSQTKASDPAITLTGFKVINQGDIPIRNIVISQESQFASSNIGAIIKPSEKDLVRPGESFDVRIKYEGKFTDRQIDDITYIVRGEAPGNNTNVSTKFTNVFLMSGAGCLKVSPKKYNFDLEIGESETKRIIVTNNCAESVKINHPYIDKRNALLKNTIGDNSLSFVPLSNPGYIPVGASSAYIFKLDGKQYFQKYNEPVKLNAITSSGVAISSEPFTFTIEVISPYKEVQEDYLNTRAGDVPICKDPEDVGAYINFPKLSDKCSNVGKGYCNAYGATNLILSKINDLQADVESASTQLDNQTDNTECQVLTNSSLNYCKLENIDSDLQPIELTIFLQNDVVAPKLVEQILRKDLAEGKNKFSKINSFMTTPYTGKVTSGLGFGVNKIHFPSNMKGCGKYKLEISGAVAANYNNFQPKKAYYYVKLEKISNTSSCNKNIENVLLYMPLDKQIVRTADLGSWQIMFTGNQEIAVDVSEELFENKYRFAPNLTKQANSNVLEIKIGEIKEDPNALAKLKFLDPITSELQKPEFMQITINENYLVKEELNEEVLNKISNTISQFIEKRQFADICISENKDYLLIRKFFDLGEFKFNIKDKNPKLQIKNGEFCKDFIIQSNISEVANIETTKFKEDIADIYYKYNKKEVENNILKIVLDKDKKQEFSVCLEPKTLLNKLVDKKVNVTATSRYKDEKGTGFREESKQLVLTTCGVTPRHLFENVVSKTQEMKNQTQGSSNTSPAETFNALVSWNNSYSKHDKEDICKSLQRYLDKTKNTNLNISPSGIAGCNLELPEAYKKSKSARAQKNAFKYFGSCMAACSGCIIIADLAWNFLPIAGQAKILSDILLDCGLGCGIPSGLYYLRNSETRIPIWETIKGWALSIFSPKAAKNYRQSLETNNIKELNTQVKGELENVQFGEQAVGVAAGGLLSGRRYFKRTALEKTTRAGALHLKDLKTKLPSGISTTTGGKPISAISSSKLARYKGYLTGSSGTYNFTPDPSDVTDFASLKTKIESSGFKSLNGAQKSSLSKIIKKGNFTHKGGGGAHLIKPQGSKFADELADTAKVIDPADGLKLKGEISSQLDDLGKTKSSLDDLIKNGQLSSKKLTTAKKNLVKVNTQIDDLGKMNGMIDDSGKFIGDSADDFKNLITKTSNNADDLTKMTKISAWGKMGKFAGGLIKGLACTIFGNFAGVQYLKSFEEKGVLQNTIQINSDIKYFENNTVYKIDLSVGKIENASNSSDKGYILNISLADERLDNRLDNCAIEKKN